MRKRSLMMYNEVRYLNNDTSQGTTEKKSQEKSGSTDAQWQRVEKPFRTSDHFKQTGTLAASDWQKLHKLLPDVKSSFCNKDTIDHQTGIEEYKRTLQHYKHNCSQEEEWYIDTAIDSSEDLRSEHYFDSALAQIDEYKRRSASS